MKHSQYNHIIQDDKRTCFFNSYRRGLHEISPAVQQARILLKRNDPDWAALLSDGKKHTLIHNGYVIPNEFDEQEELLREREGKRLFPRSISLTVAPTITGWVMGQGTTIVCKVSIAPGWLELVERIHSIWGNSGNLRDSLYASFGSGCGSRYSVRDV